MIALQPTIEDARRHIYSMDMVYVFQRLLFDRKKNKFSKREITQCIEMYRNYLFLLKKYGDHYPIIPPSQGIDEIWHQHILHTRRYSIDCMEIFGEYLHHNPGDRTSKSLEMHNDAFQNITQKLYFAEFKKSISK